MASTAHLRAPGPPLPANLGVNFPAPLSFGTPASGGEDTEIELITKDKPRVLGGIADGEQESDGDEDDVHDEEASGIRPAHKFTTTARRPILSTVGLVILWPFLAVANAIRSRLYYNINATATTEHRLPNYICCLSAWLFTGLPAIVLSMNEYEAGLTPSYLPITGHPAFDVALATLVGRRQHIYLLTLVVTSFIGLADRRGGLPGLPFFRRHFNIYLQLGRVLTLLSMIGTACAMWLLPGIYVMQITALWVVGMVCKLLASQRQGYYYALYTFLWNNCSSACIIMLYLYIH